MVGETTKNQNLVKLEATLAQTKVQQFKPASMKGKSFYSVELYIDIQYKKCKEADEEVSSNVDILYS